MKPRILILTDFYLPGYKSGGAVRTLVNMVRRMRDEFDFTIITRNHDGWGNYNPYPGINSDTWNKVEDEAVFYFDKKGISGSRLKQLWHEANPDAVFAVSFFSDLTTKALILRRLKQLPRIPFVLAPQGELSAGALNIKSKKKRVFLKLTKNLGIYQKIIWKASFKEEQSDIKKIFGDNEKIEVVADLSPQIILPNYDFSHKPRKMSVAMRLVFLSRINWKKNLTFVLRALQKIKGTVELGIYGENDDEAHWRECLELIKELPPNVKVIVHGSIDHSEVAETISGYHFFILPTHGENFGHVVLEAFAAGCPVLLSDQTPWRQLEAKQIGWDLSLEDPEKWQTVLERCLEMDASEFTRWSSAARRFAVEWLAAPNIEAANRDLLRRALSSKNK